MDVPFVSSGALSRKHYTLVREVENASSPQVMDDLLFAQVDTIRERFRQTSLSLEECKKFLIIILYCAMSTTATLGDLNLSFAFPHAIHLAEAATSVQDKRIGYLFCVEIMPLQHSLQLLLVNTLRKDLESPSVARICLALETVIQLPFTDLIPAVQTRLYDLLSHISMHVRKRALLALRALSKEQSDLFKPAIAKVRKRLHDPEPSVVSAALLVITDLVNSSLLSASILSNDLHDLLLYCWKLRSDVSYVSLMTRTIRALRLFSKSIIDDRKLYTDIIRFSSRPGSRFLALLLESVLSLASCPTDLLQSSSFAYISPINYIRHLLTSEDPNERYLFLCILESLEPRIWAGTVPEVPAVLDALEVERIMQLLDARDCLIRAKTLTILRNVDSSIVQSYFVRMLEFQSSAVDLDAQGEYAIRLIQVVETLSNDHGELYAQYLRQVLGKLEHGTQDNRRIFQEVVERILIYIRQAQTAFRISCTTAILTPLPEQDVGIGSTSMVIMAALACECSNITSIPPSDLLQGFSNRLPLYPVSVKEVCLLAMLRIAADCEEVTNDVVERVNKTSEVSGRHLRLRCNQFESLANQRNVLRRIVSSAKSSSLPDFAVALEAHYRVTNESINSFEPAVTPSQSSGAAESKAPVSQSKLRYEAYEAPRPTSRLSSHPPSKHRRNSASGASESSSVSVGSRFSEDAMSRTVTPGELALMARNKNLETFAQCPPEHDGDRKELFQMLDAVRLDDTAPRADLIAFESPVTFQPGGTPGSKKNVSEADFEFESVWNTLEPSNSRGWYDFTADNIVRQLQALKLQLRVIAADQGPFQGDLKVVATQESQGSHQPAVALLRLRESVDDDESCLWRLRCEDEELRLWIGRLLAN